MLIGKFITILNGSINNKGKLKYHIMQMSLSRLFLPYLSFQNRALHEDLQRKNKMKLQHKLVMKFREDRIAELERLVKNGRDDDEQNLVKLKDAEIQVESRFCDYSAISLPFHDHPLQLLNLFCDGPVHFYLKRSSD